MRVRSIPTYPSALAAAHPRSYRGGVTLLTLRPRLARSLLGAGLTVSVLSGCQWGLPSSAPVVTITQTAPAPSPTATPTGTATAPAASGTSTGTAPAATAPAPTQTPGATPPPTSAAGSGTPTSTSSVAKLDGGDGSALPLMVPLSALPPGWKEAPARNTRGYRMTVCGVDLEPVAPVDGAQANWESSTAGDNLEQHVRVYKGNTATSVATALHKAVPTCKNYEAKDAQGGKSSFTVEKLALRGIPNGAVVWRQRVDYPVPQAATATAAPKTVEVVQDVAVRRVGSAIVLLNSYGVAKTPDDTALTAALKALG